MLHSAWLRSSILRQGEVEQFQHIDTREAAVPEKNDAPAGFMPAGL